MAGISGKLRTALQITIELMLRAVGTVPNIDSTADSLRLLIETGGSISRFGDGELNTLLGGGQKFQQYDESLASRLIEILESAGVNEPNHYVAIPRSMASLRGLTGESKSFWLIWSAQNRKEMKRFYGKGRHYLDSQISRFYINRRNREDSSAYLASWKNLWAGKRILLVEGALTRFGVGSDLFENAESVHRVLCPASDAWASYDRILEATREQIRLLSVNLVLIALGPAATVLAFDLSGDGVQAIDAGNLDIEYEWYRREVRKRVPIEGKYSHEVEGGTDVADATDRKYLEETVARVE